MLKGLVELSLGLALELGRMALRRGAHLGIDLGLQVGHRGVNQRADVGLQLLICNLEIERSYALCARKPKLAQLTGAHATQLLLRIYYGLYRVAARPVAGQWRRR